MMLQSLQSTCSHDLHLLQVVTVEPGGLSRDHDDKMRLLLVSKQLGYTCWQVGAALNSLAFKAQRKCMFYFTISPKHYVPTSASA